MDPHGHERYVVELPARFVRRFWNYGHRIQPWERQLQDSDESALDVSGMWPLDLDVSRVTRAIGVRMPSLGPPLGFLARVLGMEVFDCKRPAQLIRQPAAAAA